MTYLNCKLCGGELEFERGSNIGVCPYCGNRQVIFRPVRSKEHYDVFICHKETDENGNKTKDSVIANDIYHQLTDLGLKVFFSPISLADKMGAEYESCIAGAIDTARLMLVIGTKPEYYNSLWMMDQWSRFLQLRQMDETRFLIPCFRDMDAFDLPYEFLHLQYIDMSHVSFAMEELMRMVRKLFPNGSASKPPRTEVKADCQLSGGYAFISYSTKNQNAANALRSFFHQNGINTWMAPNNIPVGSKYAEVIIKALKECSCLVLLLTNASQGSIWVAKEVERAINYKKTIIPVQLEDVVLNDEFELYISTDQIIAVDKIREDSEEMQSVLRSVKGCTEQN